MLEPTPYELNVTADCDEFTVTIDDSEIVVTMKEGGEAHVATVMLWYTAEHALYVEMKEGRVDRLMKVTKTYLGENKSDGRIKHAQTCTMSGLPELGATVT
ncbi:hypothetical protein [Vibrio sp. WXL210]|uniref:hypothetical protein n=1 Tax=Vibrio sp. WXL210 TaxID=3450709 RepID=UPI003EC58876